jgi:SNF2 family DNA or RNA helicase
VTRVKHGKLKLLGEFMEDYDKKLVIFAQFKQSIKDIGELLTKKKIKYVTLDGDQKDKNIWRKFQADDKIKVIVVQYESGSAGIDLFSSSTMIFYEPTIRSNTLEQARD